MYWWKSAVVCAGVVFFLPGLSGSAKAESILRLERAGRASEAKAKANSLELRPASLRDEPQLDRFAPYLLVGKRADTHFPIAQSRKKVVHPPIAWNDKNAKKLNVKGWKKAPKPPHFVPPEDVVGAEPASAVVMPASAAELPGSVPAPRALWGGVGMLTLLGLWRWADGRLMRA